MSKGVSQILAPLSATLDKNFMNSKFIAICGEHADQG